MGLAPQVYIVQVNGHVAEILAIATPLTVGNAARTFNHSTWLPHRLFTSRNNGEFCPDNSKCVYCSSGSTLICCQGPDGSIIPPYNTESLSVGGGTPATSAAAPDTSTEAPTPATTKPAPTTSVEIPTSQGISETTTPETQYFSTTFTYTYIVWTRITYIQSSVDHTTTTTSTTLSCLAANRAAALTTLSSLASSIQASASSSAAAASPLNTGGSPTVTATVTTNPQRSESLTGRGLSCMLLVGISLLLTSFSSF